MKKIIVLGATLLILTMSVFASTQPLHHKVVHSTEQTGMRQTYSITFEYCTRATAHFDMYCCTYTATYYYAVPGVPIVLTATESNCGINRQQAPNHDSEIPEEVKGYDAVHFAAWYATTYGATEGVSQGDDGTGDGPR